MEEKKSVVAYQRDKSYVSNAINELKGHAERLEKVAPEEFGAALYDLLEAIQYLDEVFESFAAENIPN